MSHQYGLIEETFYFYFASNDTSGSGDDGASPLADVRLAGATASDAPILSPTPVLLTNAAYPPGCHEIAVAATTGNGFATGNVYSVFCALTVDSQNPSGFVGSFKLSPVVSDLTNILGHLMTNTGTQIADAFQTMYNVATPTLLASEAMRGTDGANTTVPDAAGVAPTATEIVDEWESQSQTDPTGFYVNVREWLDQPVTLSTGNKPDVNIDEIEDSAQRATDLAELAQYLIANSVTLTDVIADNSIFAQFMASSGTISGFSSVDDAQQSIRDAITAGNPQNHIATANNETTGTLDSGTYADTATVNNVYYQLSPVTPAVGGFGLNADLTFNITVGRTPISVTITGYFDTAALRTVQIWGYDYMIAAYVQISNSGNDFGNTGSNQTFSYSMTPNMVQLSDGEVKIRATSTSTNTGDDWFWDYANVTSLEIAGAGLTADAIQAAVWARLASGHDENTLGYNLSKAFMIKGHVVSATDAKQFIGDSGLAVNDAYNGSSIMFEDKTDNHYEIRRIRDYIGATNEIFLDRDLGFTPVAGDEYYILSAGYSDVNVTHVGDTAQTANDNGADINTILSRIIGTLLTGNHNPQSGDGYSIVNDGTFGNAQLVRSTTPANALDVNATGEAGFDLDNTSGTLDAAQIGSNAITAAKIATDAITATKIAADAITSSELATSAVNEIRDAILADSTPFNGANIDAAISSRGTADTGDAMGLADDAITASKYDESTAFPVASVDSGATQIARTGADSDTLETISDQIDAVPTAVENRTEMDNNSSELAKIGTIPALDGAAQNIGAAIAKIADDNGGADFDATIHSQKGIYDTGQAGWVTGSGGDATEAKQDTIISHVDGLNGDAMRGTDGANTTVPDAAGVAPTAAEIRIEMDNNSTQLAAIFADTDFIQKVEDGEWELVLPNQLYFYEKGTRTGPGAGTILRTFNCYDSSDSPTVTDIARVE